MTPAIATTILLVGFSAVVVFGLVAWLHAMGMW